MLFSLLYLRLQGNISQWNVAEGQAFSAGDVIAEIETDKATMGWESQDDGVMAKVLKPAGAKDIEVGTLVALTVDDESELNLAKDYTPSSAAAAMGSSSPSASQEASTGAAPSSAFPIHQVWTMPALSPTMTQGNIAKWYKQVGDEVSPGDGLVEVETDKATMMWESVEDGFVAKILAPDGLQDISVRLMQLDSDHYLHVDKFFGCCARPFLSLLIAGGITCGGHCRR